MNKKNNSLFSISFYLRWPLLLTAVLAVMNLLLLAIDPHAAVTLGIFTVIFAAVSLGLYFYSRGGLYTGLIDFVHGFKGTEYRMLDDAGCGMAICDTKGKILWANKTFAETFGNLRQGAGGFLQSLFPDVTGEILGELTEDVLIHSTFDGGRCLIEMRPATLAAGELNLFGDEDPGTPGNTVGMSVDDDSDDDAAVFFSEADRPVIIVTVTDETELVKYRTDFEDSCACAGLITLDNYDEAMDSIEEVRRSLLTALVDRRINNYITSIGGIVKKLENDKYLFFVMEKDMRVMVENRFSILEEVKTINIGNDLAITLSIGVGKDCGGYNENYEAARTAIDLALGRGGDQAVVKSGDNVTYFGGKTLAPEKNARVKARVKAQAYKELLATADRVIVMGHKNSDVDSLGAAVGIWRIATDLGKQAHIVLNTVNKSLAPLYRQFIANEDYPADMFVTGEQAVSLVDKATIVTVVDTNRPSYTEEPRLLGMGSAIVVFDHHRRGTESITNATLSYIEPYASSACEMTAEIIQYIDQVIKLTPLEADAMYGGIAIDTQNFINQTGVRTFEAAAFLKRKGAAIPKIRKMFRDSFSDYKAKAGAVDAAEIYRDSFAISELDPAGIETPTVVGAQAANSLLEIDGIRAAVVLTPFNGQIYVSARSIDDVNVQVMMERIGGGGHMSVAGAQLKDMSIEEARNTVKRLIDEMIDEGEI